MEDSQPALVASELPADDARPRSMGDASMADRTLVPVYIAPEVTIGELRDALLASALHLTSRPDGSLYLDRIHTLALVRKEAA